MLLISLPNSQILCKNKWYVLKDIYAEGQVNVCACFSHYFIPSIVSNYGYKLGKKNLSF